MEVLGGQGQPEYDFDDALVSERGTTVKCTICGHQFRIFRPNSAWVAPERWEVRTADGTDLVFTSLRELQRAITTGQVSRGDLLARGEAPRRPLQSIAELEPFFPQEGRPTRTVTERPGAPDQWNSRPPVPAIPRENVEGDYDEATVPKMLARKDISASSLNRHSATHQALGEEPEFDPATQREILLEEEDDDLAREADYASNEVTHVAASVAERQQAPMDAQLPVRRQRVLTPTPSIVNTAYEARDDGATDTRFLASAPPRRSAAARWLVAAVVLGGLVVLGATVGREYLMAAVGPTASAQDPRVAQLLDAGNKQLAEGDVEAAKESFDKASVLSEHDPNVLRALARLTNIRADQDWLRLRLLPADKATAIAVVQADLDARSKQAVGASTRAFQAAASDPTSTDVAALRVDSLRLAGDLEQARKLVATMASRTSDADHAYVLAALEMCEDAPNWATVVDRLRFASAGEQYLGRARAALVYALLRSDKVDAAMTELDALEKFPQRHALLLDLKDFATRTSASPKETDGKKGKPSSSDASPDTFRQAVPIARGGADQPVEVPLSGNYQTYLSKAHAARQRGDLDSAEQYYRAALAANPGDTEATTGLGDVARARGDKFGAASYYDEAAQKNPSYLPALLGQADAQWDAGNRTKAVAIYQQVITSTSGQGTYATHARQRIAEAARAEAAAAAPAPAPTTAPSTDTPTTGESPY